MKARPALLALLLVRCAGAAAPAPSPAASPAPAATTVPAAEGSGPGPAVGDPLPAFQAPDQDGKRQDFETLRGKNGLLLNFNRSVVW
jgi:hypothetical protein